MPWAVALADRAQKSRKGLPSGDRRRVDAALEAMQTDPLSGDVVKLKGTDAFRWRVGSYRIMFDINFKTRLVRVFDIVRRPPQPTAEGGGGR